MEGKNVFPRPDFSFLSLACPSSCYFLLIYDGKRDLSLLRKLSIKFPSLFLELERYSFEVTWPLGMKVFGTDFLCQCNIWQPLYNNFMLMFGPTVNNVVSVMNS